MKRNIYLDYAAATPLDERVMEAMKPYFAEKFYNPAANYLPAKTVAKDVESARQKIAYWLGTRPAEIIFTAGGTESSNLAIHGVMRRFPDAKVLVSGVEHESVLAPAGRYDCQKIPVDKYGRVNPGEVKKLIDNNTVLVSIIYANNEIGTIEPLKDIAAVIEDVRKQRLKQDNELPLYLHTDACQAGGYLDLHVARLGVDMMTINGDKIYGPKQSGALYVRGGIRLEPIIDGGNQEHGLRSGTVNVPAVIGLAKALDLIQQNRHDETKRLKGLQDLFFKLIKKQIPQAAVNGPNKQRLPGNVHITIPGQDNERLLIKLDEAGIQAAAGSACNASSQEPSQVLKAVGLSDDQARASLRFAMGRTTTKEDIKFVVSKLASLVE